MAGRQPGHDGATSGPPPSACHEAERHRRVRELVHEHMDFVWRSLRRLGVSAADCDDGCQRVWVVVAQKVDGIEAGKMKSYIFSVALRVASEMRRFERRHRHVELDEHHTAPQPLDPEGLLDEQRARQLLDELLSTLSWDLRTVFVMFEIEGFSSPEIAEALAVSRGTVASRLRLAREAFQRGLRRRHVATLGARGLLSPNLKTTPNSGWLP
jgi:RNA polymerase sigma-70 factor (ECF subfamily)